ncbi:YceI family protein [Terriglobus saanensis]|uniref:YceI family protein n=1 Tax=Terriglobus saanensis (strain ATCC BAA-1853 / DSM 23119 / SP1PR4) TaxID=401053 RepID=E8V3C4_TERSS|nr:YceI family protein [Terriglobus saanensis]ADV82481.1 YceI family protein [Terriglobus saanensis SP1PR4]
MKPHLNRRSAIFALALASLSLALPSFAQVSNWKIDPAHSSVNFQIRHLAVSNVHGAFSKVTGDVVWNEKDPGKSSVIATIDATTVNTDNDKRDGHLKSPDFFDVANFPTLTFKSTSVKNVNGKLQLIGDLTLHGQTKSVTLDVDGPVPPQTNNGKTVSGFSATGLIKRSDFNFGPKFAPPTVGDEIKFTIDLEVDKQ